MNRWNKSSNVFVCYFMVVLETTHVKFCQTWCLHSSCFGRNLGLNSFHSRDKLVASFCSWIAWSQRLCLSYLEARIVKNKWAGKVVRVELIFYMWQFSKKLRAEGEVYLMCGHEKRSSRQPVLNRPPGSLDPKLGAAFSVWKYVSCKCTGNVEYVQKLCTLWGDVLMTAGAV